MSKIIKSFAFILMFAMCTVMYAEVQNVKVSGELRLRAYHSDNISDTSDAGDDDFGWLENRAVLEVEADLTDNTLVVVELTGEGAWGSTSNQPVFGGQKSDYSVGVTQAFVQLSEAFYSPLTLKLGRQYLHFGNGWLFSDAERANNFDLVRATLDYYPWTVDGIYGKLSETAIADDDVDLYGVNGGYNAESWNAEAYAFAISDESVANDQPISIGIRGDALPNDALDVWGEFTYQLGESGAADYDAFAAEVGLTILFNFAWEPALSVRYIFATGDETSADNEAFNELYEYDYYGYAFSPSRSNIQIFNAQLSALPMDNVTVMADYYYYAQDETVIASAGDAWQDNGGVSALTNGLDDQLGSEIDFVAEYDYSEDVSTQFYVALFFPGDAYTVDDTALEVRGEILVSF